MVAPIGPLATVSRESRQARKGATVVVILCAEVWLVGVTAIYTPLYFLHVIPTECSDEETLR